MNLPPRTVICDFGSDLDQTLLLLSLHERVIRPRKGIFERLQSILGAQDLILKPRKPRLTCPGFVSLANGEPKGGIKSQKVSLAAILMPGCYLIHPLLNHLNLNVIVVNA